MAGTSLLVALFDQRAAKVASWFQARRDKNEQEFIASAAKLSTTVQFKPSCSFPSWALLVRILNLSAALVLVPCRCLLSCSLSVTFKPTMHTVHFLLELPLLALLLPFRCSGSRSLCAAVFTVLLVFCHVQACDLRTPSRALVRVSGVRACATKQLRVSFTAHAHYVLSGQTDTRTHGQTNFRWTIKCGALLTLAPNYIYIDLLNGGAAWK